ncbi:hypothetical protein SAMN06265338_11826 [Rhodoblastus acidophilus]|uniref:Uncharacterized protein n=1 Tax=Rhodoblastus acidophilus TaxID=1074 RepID=A0A212S9R6_RHOAC|nr:hypothetical protein [Rhodoblastus acidophilus]PPQ36059.1 hypothetical protein CKO16_18930 [Rhodoblastus acidophilus]RAI18794.1 hypothetical protein CH337_13615 [Rhodoblastus acidophilus]SNB82175.1 hypothetical protein SAMN06265338_11826 [Rhodoblastus acidophilus]
MIGEAIYLVGSYGYHFERGAAIQALRLDTRDFHVETVETSGEVPDWISRHRAERIGETGLLIFGGAIFSRDNARVSNGDPTCSNST